jgi:hypothetical protein
MSTLITVPGASNIPVTVSTTTGDVSNYALQIGALLSTIQGASNLSITMDSATGSIPTSPFTTNYASGTTGDLQRLYQGLLDRNADDAGMQYWTSQSGGGGASLATIADAFTASPEFAGRYGSLSDAAFVDLLYQNMFGRPADMQYINGWLGMLSGGASRGAVAASIAESAEAESAGHQTVDDVAHSAIYRLYEAAFGRPPDEAGDALWTTLLAQGATLQQIAASIAGSSEFQPNTTSSDGDFVTTLYSNLLGRVPDQAGLDFWTASLTGGESRPDVLAAFAASPEARGAWDGISIPFTTELVLDGAGGMNVSVPAGYNYIIENSAASDTLTASNAVIVENTVGGTLFLSDNSTLAAAGGNHTVSATGNYNLSFGPGDNAITAAGSGRIAMDEGTSTIDVTGSNDTILAGGATMTVSASASSSGLSVIGGTGPLTFIGAGNLAYSAGAGNASLNAASATGNVAATLAGFGNDSITTGSGSDTLMAGAGPDTLNAGDGSNLFQFVFGQTDGAADVIGDSATQLASDTFNFVNYDGLPVESLTNGALTLTLSDSTTIVFTNLTSISQLGHINIVNIPV